MIDIPVDSPLSYLGIFFAIVGFFLVLAGSNILKVENITVASGNKTLITGVALILLGIVFLLPDIKPQLASQESTPTPITDLPVETESSAEDALPTPPEKWELGELIYEETFEDDVAKGLHTKWGTFDIVATSDGNHVWRTEDFGFTTLSLPTSSNDYAFEAKIKQVSGDDGLGMVAVRLVPSDGPCYSSYTVYMDTDVNWLTLVEFNANCEELRETGMFSNFNYPLVNGVWYTLRLETKGKEVRVYLDNEFLMSDRDIDGAVLESNIVGLSACCEKPNVFEFDDIKAWTIKP